VTSSYGWPTGIRLTSKEIRATRFTRPPVAWHGYPASEVDRFVAAVADAMAEAERERAALRTEIGRLRDFFRSHAVEVDRVRRAEDRDRRRAGGLVGHVAEYTRVQVQLAQQFASLLGTSAEDADSLLYHARVRASLAVEQAVVASAKDEDHGVPDRDELRRATLWLRAFGYAMQVQVDGATDALRNA
jgi:DivIVA domain-containing protein